MEIEMVLGLKVADVINAYWERGVRASLLLALSAVLYCFIRVYAVDFSAGNEEAAAYGGGMKQICGMFWVQAECIYGNVNGASMGLYRREAKNVADQKLAGYRQIAGIAMRVEHPVSRNVADTGEVERNLRPAEDSWSDQEPWDESLPELIIPNEIVTETNVPFIREEDTSADENDETREMAGFLVDLQGYIVGITDDLSLMDGILAVASDSECVGIRKNAFSGVEDEVLEIYIPANICDIEQGTFGGFLNLMYIEVAEDNLHYYSMDGILYSKSGEEIAYPAGR